MKIEPGNYCPLIKKECIGLECAWFMKVSGVDARTGESTEEWGCSVTWIPAMVMELAKQQRGNNAAVESFRNAMVDQNAAAARMVQSLAHQAREQRELEKKD